MRAPRFALLALVLLALDILAAQLAVAAPKRLTLGESIARTRHNPVARAALAEQRAAEAQADEARGARWPRAQLVSFLAPSPEIRCADVDCTRTSPVNIAPSVAGVFAGARLDVALPLYTFGKLDAAVEAGTKGAQFSAARADGVIGDLAVEATRAYFGVELSRELVLMLEAGAEQIAKGKQTLSERLESGDPEVTVQDRLRLEALQTEILVRLSEAREKEATALGGLRALVGDPEVDVAETTLAPVTLALGQSEDYWQRAQKSSPELRAAEHGLSALAQRTALEQARWLPDIALAFGGSVARAQGVDDPPSAFANDPFNGERAELGLLMRWQIEPALQVARVARAEADQARGSALADGARAAVEFAVRDAHNRALEARTRLDLARQGEKSARGWVASVVQADAVGTASARELADAYLAYFTLRGRVLQSTYEWNLAAAALERATGELSPSKQP
jgi:outer membrane protein TolC